MEEKLDYALRRNWIKKPAEPLKHDVDVFFVYPTVYIHPDKEEHHLMPLENPVFRAAARISSFWHDRFAARSCNVFAPYYRQVGLETLWMRHARFDNITKVPYHDVRDAFFYYLANLNEGRPFILAGHSQGSEMLIKLLCHDFAHLSEAERMIAAYTIGYSVTKEELAEFPHIHLVTGEDDLGGIISYNTSAEGLEVLPVVRPGALCVNPLNWRQDSAYAPKSENLGSILFEAGTLRIEKKNFTGAYIDEEHGTLMIDKDALEEIIRVRSRFGDKETADRKSLHSLDIALFQENLAQNVEVRIDAYRKKAARS